jgi:peptide chain release factor 2
MGEAGFWDDPDAAAKVNSEYARVNRRLTAFTALEEDVELLELADEDEDVEETLASVESRLEELELERLFSGRYDAGDALVTVNSGAGGTDAQDWAEMVLRMEMRWAERRGF